MTYFAQLSKHFFAIPKQKYFSQLGTEVLRLFQLGTEVIDLSQLGTEVRIFLAVFLVRN